MGLGHAATRDVASFLRYRDAGRRGHANPLRAGGPASAASTRPGRRRPAASCATSCIMGSTRTKRTARCSTASSRRSPARDRVFINVRFADPNVYSGQDDRHDFLQNSYPPFTYAVVTDPMSGIPDGIMKRPATDPVVLPGRFVDRVLAAPRVAERRRRQRPRHRSAAERAAVLSSRARRTASASAGCSPRRRPPTHAAISSALRDERFGRALLAAMDAWVDAASSRRRAITAHRQRNARGRRRGARRFPKIPGVRFPGSPNPLEQLDYGPGFNRLGGVVTNHPPLASARYPVLVPKADSDGFDLAGIHLVQVRAPLGTTTGWNMRTATARAGELCGLSGSYFPLAATAAERAASGDSRRSLEERVPDP